MGESIWKDVWAWGTGKYMQVRNRVYYPPPPPVPPPLPPPLPEPPVRHTTGSESAVQYDPVAEARKAQVRTTESRPSGAVEPLRRGGLCSPPYRMTASDGCQK